VPVLVALVAAGVLGMVTLAGSAPSNAGTIKIFDGDKELPANDPKACNPEVRGLEFEANETGIVVTIEGQGGPNVGGPSTFTGTFDADALGDFTTGVITLEPGQYKANANDGEGGGDKNKVFRVECVTPPTTVPPTTAPPTTVPATVPPQATTTDEPAAEQAPPPAPAPEVAVEQAPPPAPVEAQPRTTG